MDERTALLAYLQAQRDSVLAVLTGLTPAGAARSVVPSGWTPHTLLEHLADAEWYWFPHVLGGVATRAARDPDPVTAYLAQCEISDGVLAGLGLDAPAAVPVPPEHVDLAQSARTVVLHMIEETARHAGHLDIARELLDGTTGLGPR